jgi:predicted methyltransferase
MTDDRLFPATMMPDSDWWHELWPDPGEVLRRVGIKPEMHVVDLCCGDGYFTKPLCQLVHPGTTWAVDLDEGLLGQAEVSCQDFPNFHAILSDAMEIPKHIGDPVDFVFIANTFHGVPNKTALSLAVYQILKTGGLFAIINWYPRPREETIILDQPRGPDTHLRMDPERVRQIVEPVGFELDKVDDVGPYHYASIFKKVILPDVDTGSNSEA